MGEFVYQGFKENDFYDFQAQYHGSACTENSTNWVCKDFGKYNCHVANPKTFNSSTKVSSIWLKDIDLFHMSFVLISDGDEYAHSNVGGPAHVVHEYLFGVNSTTIEIKLNVTLYDKTMTRLPESSWVSFKPKFNNSNNNSWNVEIMG